MILNLKKTIAQQVDVEFPLFRKTQEGDITTYSMLHVVGEQVYEVLIGSFGGLDSTGYTIAARPHEASANLEFELGRGQYACTEEEFWDVVLAAEQAVATVLARLL